MKNLVLIVHTSAQQGIADLLRGLDQIKGFTFSQAEGHGIHSEEDSFLSARDKVVGYTPQMRVDILLEDEDVKTVLAAIRTEKGLVVDQGFFWVTPIEMQGHLT